LQIIILSFHTSHCFSGKNTPLKWLSLKIC